MQEDRPPMQLSGKKIRSFPLVVEGNCYRCYKVQLVQHLGEQAPCIDKLVDMSLSEVEMRVLPHGMRVRKVLVMQVRTS